MKSNFTILLVLLSFYLVSGQTGPCNIEVFRQLDFWVGEWDVKSPQGQIQGYNHIEIILDSCVIKENWTGTGPSRGQSFNSYDARTGMWHQTWVDNFGSTLQLDGQVKSDTIIYKGSTNSPNETTVLQKMMLAKVNDDKVHQIWSQSRDNGKSWTTVFEGMYHRKE